MIVRAMPEELRVIEDYLERTQLAINRQVVLEAKIVNVVLSDGFQTGINWAKLQGSSTFGQVGGGTIFDGGVSEIAGQTPVNIVPISPGGTGRRHTGNGVWWRFQCGDENQGFHVICRIAQDPGRRECAVEPAGVNR